MRVQRGDVVLVTFPFSSGAGAKLRPALVVQSDHNNSRLLNTVLAAITTTTHRTFEATQLLVEVATPEGQQSGLLFDSAVTCETLATVEHRLIQRKIGSLPTYSMSAIDACLKAALAIN
jgi:mRNA interferase MazF